MEAIKSKLIKSRRMTMLMLVFAFIAGLMVGLIFHDSLVRQPVPDTDIHRWYPR
jgi:hypothetical protein